ncbi:hypothetical protein AB0F15_30885 [Amycolatopsis sp. NPDC026612]|uniref:hypothetical protein n=1 Tax=Amycolatopsis sp. NPDC026612 TaxID=3155466 RepID=UPI003401F126
MFPATRSRVVDLANGTDFGNADGYLAAAVVPTMCETAVLVAAVGAGAAVAACAGYVANAWANNVGHHHGHHGHRDAAEAPAGLDAAGGSLAGLIDARTDVLR